MTQPLHAYVGCLSKLRRQQVVSKEGGLAEGVIRRLASGPNGGLRDADPPYTASLRRWGT